MPSGSQGLLQAGEEIDNALASIQSAGIIIPDRNGVSAYLYTHPEVAGVLPRAAEACAKRFRAHTQLSLELYRDPEIDDEYLTIYARQKPYQDNILDLIDQISEEIASGLNETSGWLHITTDFKPPR